MPGVWYDIYTGLLVLGLIAGAFVYIRRRPLSRGNTPRRHLYRNTSQSVMWICVTGLFFCLMRYVELPYLDMRFFSYLVVLGAIAYAGYLTFYLSERFPIQNYNFGQLEADKRYRAAAKRRPQPATATAASGRSNIQRGKRRR